MWWPRASIRWALVASALLHLAFVVVLSEVEPPRRAPAPERARNIEIEVAPIPGGAAEGSELRRTAESPAIVPGGLPSTGALDRIQHEGRGGELQALERGALLFPFRSPFTLQDTELNNLAVSQVQRIHTAAERATLEARRASPNAADAVLLVSGQRGHQERRDPALRDPTHGAPRPSLPSTPSTAAEQREPGPGPGEAALEAPVTVAREAAQLRPAQGILGGQGRAEARAARVAHARPNVDKGPAATPSEQVDPRIRDDVDAELLAAKLQRSFIDTSVQRAQQVGPGSGGTLLNPEAHGERGQGSGAQARPYTPGRGNFDALDTSDARYLRWFTQQRERVQRELVFPRARALAKDQGTSLYRVVLDRAGALSGTPRLIRSSGYPDFDSAAAIAIQRALPFAPLPAELAPELDHISLLIPIAFANPMVE